MKLIFRLLVALVGIFNVGIGLAFLLRPEETAAGFFVQPDGLLGLASIRADFSAFFAAAGLFSLQGAWRSDPLPLRVPLLLFAVALFGRTVNLVAEGVAPNAFAPMIIEAMMIVIMVGAMLAFRDAATDAQP